MTGDRLNSTLKTACIIVAGGAGLRLGGEQPKQFLPLGGMPLLAWSVKYFGSHPGINRLIVVVPEGWEARAAELLGNVPLSTNLKVVAGGTLRQDSVLAGIQAAGDCDLVAIHDGARPFPPENLSDILEKASETGGAIYAMPVTDSVKFVNGGIIQRTVPRQDLWAAQTPQVFVRTKLLEALEYCREHGRELTDDASAFEQMGWPVAIVTGTRGNVKITYAEDFTMAEQCLKGKAE